MQADVDPWMLHEMCASEQECLHADTLCSFPCFAWVKFLSVCLWIKHGILSVKKAVHCPHRVRSYGLDYHSYEPFLIHIHFTFDHIRDVAFLHAHREM